MLLSHLLHGFWARSYEHDPSIHDFLGERSILTEEAIAGDNCVDVQSFTNFEDLVSDYKSEIGFAEWEWDAYVSKYPFAFSPGKRIFSSASEAWIEVASESV
jgi:hypothetical protein